MDRTWIYKVGLMPISVENLRNLFKLRKTMQKIRRKRGYLAGAKHARI
jgi:hypothetical protein